MKRIMTSAFVAFLFLTPCFGADVVVEKTRDQLIADLEGHKILEGTYNAGDRPLSLYTTRPTMVASVANRATIKFSAGPCVMAGWKEPTPPASLWMPDGGLHLKEPDTVNPTTGAVVKGIPWRITVPVGNYTHPGKAPRFWADLTLAEWTFDFKLAAYVTPAGGSYPLFGLYDRDNGPSPIMVLAQGEYVNVYWRDATGYHTARFKVLVGTPDARNKFTLTYTPGKFTVSSSLGAFETVVNGSLVENIDAAFQIGNGAHNIIGDPIFAPGDLTVYSMKFKHSPGAFSATYDLPLTIPEVGDWWLKNGAILSSPSKASESFGAPQINIENVNIFSLGGAAALDGATISTSYSGHGLIMRNVDTKGNLVGLQSMSGPSYPHVVDNWHAMYHALSAYKGYAMIATLNDCVFDRNGRDSIIARGGWLKVNGGLVVPAGSTPLNQRQTTVRMMAFEDATWFAATGLMINDEGTYPSIAHFYGDNRMSRFGYGDFRMVIRDSHSSGGDNFAKLVGTPKNAWSGGFFKIDNVTSLSKLNTIDATPTWKIEGKVDGNLIP